MARPFQFSTTNPTRFWNIEAHLNTEKMSLKSSNLVHTPLTLPRNTAIYSTRAIGIDDYRLWRRRKLKKSNRKLVVTVRSQLVNSSPFDNFFQNLVSHFPSSVNSLDLIAPALGFASGLALYFSRPNLNRNSVSNSRLSDIGDWILFSSPTPFNRFVMLRCPSISFEGSEVEDVNEKLVKEDMHFVRLNTGRIQLTDSDLSGEEDEGNMVIYQRKCVSTDDGGVISLDWPANLDLSEEHGLDTTLLLIPGTAEGSMDKNVQSFVSECLKRGCFPVVMNPRGCSGSPLTTARLFTAADSDDISTAIQFIDKARRWTTLMGVGWGYGANMLTKYLAEAGEKTPFTAATCIDNPFDLEEVTRSSPYHLAVDQKLTGGLIDILRSNKELFQGRTNQFDVENALLATSVRDFEKAISMVSYGFNAIEDFYAKSSTQGVVGNVKIPLLFIQNDDGTVPVFSIPRSSIAENPYTSLLLCSCPQSSIITSGRSSVSWCQNLTIEWLTAVELGLLKGRHPLLKDVDVNINPSKGLAVTEGGEPNKGGQVEILLNLPRIENVNGHSLNLLKYTLGESDIEAGLHSRYGGDSQRNSEDEHDRVQEGKNEFLHQTTSIVAEVVKENGVDPVDNERGEVLQTAEVVMNMLNATNPHTLTEEEKKKVLTALGQGETLIKALQDAVPEDVREKLTTTVSGILQNQRSNLKFEGLESIGQIPKVVSGLKVKMQGKVGEITSAEVGAEDSHSSVQKKSVDDMADDSDENQPSIDNPLGALISEPQATDNFQNSINTDQLQSTSNHGTDISGSGEKETNELESNYENTDFSREKDSQYTEHLGNLSEISSEPEISVGSGRSNSTEDQITDQFNVKQDGEKSHSDAKEDNTIQQNEEKNPSLSTDKNKMITNTNTNTEARLSPSASSTETQLMEKEGSENQKRDEKSIQPVHNENSSDTPTFSVSQALDALTGIDDSTQAAVNSVFNVIEGMITQLEEERDDGTDVENRNQFENQGTVSVSDSHQNLNDVELRQKGHNQNEMSLQSDKLGDVPLYNQMKSNNDSRASCVEEKPIHNPNLFAGNSNHISRRNDLGLPVVKGNGKEEHLVGSKLSAKSSDKVRAVEKVPHDIPRCICTIPYGDPFYSDYLRKYLISKMKNATSLDLDTTAALFLDYFPEEGQWKLLEQTGHSKDYVSDIKTPEGIYRKVHKEFTDEIIEPSYVILDSEKQQEPVGEYERVNTIYEKAEIGDATSEELMLRVKKVVFDSLMIEVGRRLSAADIKEMEPNLTSDLEHVSHAAFLALSHGKCRIPLIEGEARTSVVVNTLLGEHIVRAISLAVQKTSYLRRVLPVGVIVGSSLAALRIFFDASPANSNCPSEAVPDQFDNSGEIKSVQAVERETIGMSSDNFDQKYVLNKPINRSGEIAESNDVNSGSVMVGAVTAALGVSALLVHQQDYEGSEISGTSSKFLKKKENHQEPGTIEQEMSEKSENNIVTSLAEKAMTVAGPVVPTKEDGEVDQERLVAMLAEWGQKGGMLKLVGKVALLWGGIRGAMSLTDKLISFLRLAERPLLQRILGFVCMVIVLWTPVIVPLLPTIVQSWATHSSAKFAELACVIGLYASIMILITLWGKRIRGYQNPLEQYGLDLTSSPKIQNFLMGLVGGVVLVLSIHSINALIGCVHLSWPLTNSSATNALATLKGYGQMLMLFGQGLVTATGVALVEELLFRSWLPDEIATDLGYHRGIIISGLAFSLSQRMPWAIPGLWLLSLCLAGSRQRCEGSLSLPIGLRAGIMATSFILKKGGFLTYQPNFPLWLTGTHSFQPFSGIVGLAISLLLAIVLYPSQQPLLGKKIQKTVGE